MIYAVVYPWWARAMKRLATWLNRRAERHARFYPWAPDAHGFIRGAMTSEQLEEKLR